MLENNGHPMTLGGIVGITVLSLLLAGKATAEPTQLFAGGEGGSGQAYAYVGALQPWGEHAPNWATRYWLDAQRYDYDSNGRTVVAKAAGLTPAVVRSFPFENGYLAISAGLRFAETNLSPDDPGNKQRGFKTSLPLQIDGQRRLNKWLLSAIASTEPDVGSYWSRARLVRERSLGDLSLGFEVIAKGSDEYSATQAGLIVGGIAGGLATLKIGTTRQEGRAPGIYAGVEVGVPLGK